ncbi:hypothetical protein NSP08_24135, partial [Salmonella enterica]|nr:hypothetical protein [Salmonella enterica]
AIVIGLILLERHGRKRQRYANTQRMRPMQPRRLRGAAAALAAVLAMIPLSRSAFYGSMAISIMGGLIVGTVLTLV